MELGEGGATALTPAARDGGGVVDRWLAFAGEASTALLAEDLAYGVAVDDRGDLRVAARVGGFVLDLAPITGDDVFARPTLDAFLASGAAAWHDARARLIETVLDARRAARAAPHVRAAADVVAVAPFSVADSTDFYSSRRHAENVGRVLRPDADPLPRNWLHLPVGYHGRAGTVLPSPAAVRRPRGQRLEGDAPAFGPSTRLDFEVEVGFVVGVGSELGSPVAPADLTRHVFGVVLLNDWSARDIQAYEYVPLGPFLGKSFATTISSWVLPLEALARRRIDPPNQDPLPAAYLHDDDPWAIDLPLHVMLNGEVVTRPNLSFLYWTPGQQLAHLTSNGASLRTGDLFATGTLSGEDRSTWGSLLEITENGRVPLTLDRGATRTFLEDGDEVVISLADAPVGTGPGAAVGVILPATDPASTPPGRA